MKMKNYIVTISFVLFLLSFTVLNFITPQKAFSRSENRYLATFPSLTVENILSGKFTEGFEKYATDQFVMRDNFIGINVFSQLAMGHKDSNGAYFGKDGYLLEKISESDIESHRLEKNIKYLGEFFEYLKGEEKIQSTTAMIIPTAPFVLKDKLPANAVQYDQGKAFNSLGEALGTDFLDTFRALSANSEEYIFYRTDHHWTVDGAFLAYKELCKKLGFNVPQREDYNVETISEDFLGTVYSKVQLPNIKKDQMLKFVDDEGFKVTYNYKTIKNSLYEEAALLTTDKYVYYLNGNNAVTEIETGVKNGRHLLVIKDSFAHCFVPFLTKNFEKITMIDYRYFNASTKDVIEKEGITDVLVMYNAVNFAGDRDLYNIIG